MLDSLPALVERMSRCVPKESVRFVRVLFMLDRVDSVSFDIPVVLERMELSSDCWSPTLDMASFTAA